MTAPHTIDGVALAMESAGDDSRRLCALFDEIRADVGYSQASTLWMAACRSLDGDGGRA